MTKYVPKTIVREILTSNSNELLGMKPANLTIMFCNIQVTLSFLLKIYLHRISPLFQKIIQKKWLQNFWENGLPVFQKSLCRIRE